MAGEKAETGLAGRYANAVFELARDQGALDAVSADLAALGRAVQSSPGLARLIHSPAYSRETQARALKALLAAMDTGPLATKFVLLLTARRRLFALAAITKAYESLLAAARGETEAEVTSARPLADGEIADLKSVLKAKLGREPRLTAKVDPRLLGGLVVKVGSRMIDTSLRAKLTGLAAVMKGH